ncbi:hypothetical protein GCM10022419_121880 [Nonomuraea rosea]|uniref:Uncharacterized protein n=1 Tax=Nonomuraea rosea TaxID=638574 RepID=A0ABP6ZS68_9ACTN
MAAASTAAANLRQYAEHPVTAVVRDALAAGLDWWALGEHLGPAPLACTHRPPTSSTAAPPKGLRTPAQQRPDLAVVCTAGLLDAHDLDNESGIDLDDLGDDHSLTQDLSVVRLRTAAAAVGEDAWIAVRLPGTYEGEDEIDDNAAISRWSTVVTHPDELGWLREALHHRDETEDPDDELEPL